MTIRKAAKERNSEGRKGAGAAAEISDEHVPEHPGEVAVGEVKAGPMSIAPGHSGRGNPCSGSGRRETR